MADAKIKRIAKLQVQKRKLFYETKKYNKWQKVEHWEFKTTSQLPRALYWNLTSYVFRLVKKARKEKDIPVLQKAIRQALIDLAVAWGCKWKISKSGRSITFSLGSRRWYCFRITDLHHYPAPDAPTGKGQSVLREFVRKHNKNFVRMEANNPALCRGAWVMFKKYEVMFVAGNTRQED